MIADFLLAAVVTFFACFIVVPILLAFVRLFGFYAVVQERTCRVYILFGKVLGTLDEPGLHVLPLKLGPAAFLVHWLGSCRVVDMRLDQEYLRSQAVNSEEGAPMGIGIWYEMFVSDPVAFLFRNADPRGSLAANVSNATVRCLSNMPLEKLLENRHEMSAIVRGEVSDKSSQWGYRVGSAYIRKVHFRDVEMIRQIEAKVVNRLRQVTAAIRQNGTNEVGIVASTAERQAAVEFARAAAIRPRIVGNALHEISQDPEIERAVFELLEIERIQAAGMPITMVPEKSELLAGLIADRSVAAPAAPPPTPPRTRP